MKRIKLSTDMVFLLDTLLREGPQKADNFIRVALARLASMGAINVVDGMGAITAKGEVITRLKSAKAIRDAYVASGKW